MGAGTVVEPGVPPSKSARRAPVRVAGALFLFLFLFAGCFSHAPTSDGGPPLQDRGQIPGDIEAPPPEDVFPEEDLVDPPEPGEPYSIFGRVRDPAGRGVAARLWVETVNLRDPVHNVDAYRIGMEATMRVTDAQGNYVMQLEGGFYHLRATAPGYLPVRTEPILNDEGANRHDIVLVPDIGPRVLAHRGASFYAPENTIPALDKARYLGAHAAEVDVRLTSDGHLALVHDATLARTTNGTGAVRQTPWSHMRGLDAGAWFDPSFTGTRIPRLQDALDTQPDLELVLDLKAAAADVSASWDALAAVVAATDAGPRVLIASFTPSHVSACARTTGLRCAWIVSSAQEAPIVARAVTLGADRLLLRQDLIDQTLLANAHARGIQVDAWTANDPQEWDVLLDLGVDGILTDHPGYLLDHILERRLAEAAGL